jgi:hypothetical protein
LTRMTPFLVLEQVVFAWESSCMSPARRNGATMGCGSVDLTCMPVKATLVAESRVLATDYGAYIRPTVLSFVFPGECESV